MKTPTRSPTHEEVPMSRLASMGLDLEDIADAGQVTLAAVVELAEDNGRLVSHYLAAVPLATDLSIAATPAATLTVRVCAGSCQKWGALDLLESLATPASPASRCSLQLVSCLDRCDQAPVVEVLGSHGTLVVAPATKDSIEEALQSLA